MGVRNPDSLTRRLRRIRVGGHRAGPAANISRVGSPWSGPRLSPEAARGRERGVAGVVVVGGIGPKRPIEMASAEDERVGVRNSDSLMRRVRGTPGSGVVVPRGNRNQAIADHVDQRQIDDLGMRVADDTCRGPLVPATAAQMLEIDSQKLRSQRPA